jgi:hypothetical protein
LQISAEATKSLLGSKPPPLTPISGQLTKYSEGANEVFVVLFFVFQNLGIWTAYTLKMETTGPLRKVRKCLSVGITSCFRTLESPSTGL